MQSLTRPLRLLSKAPRAQHFLRSTQPSLYRNYATYGNSQSGHAKDEDTPNPKEHLEHPGPEAPASKGTAKSSSSSSSSSATPSAGQSQSNNGASQEGSPAIHHPKSAAEDESPEVKEHNEDMKKRFDQTPNQLEEAKK